MADNVLISQGTSTAIKTDEVGTTHYQVIKLDRGVDGSANPFTGTIDELTNLAAGTVSVLEGGTVGRVDSLGTIEGTIENVGTVHKVGTVGAITGGSVVVTLGTAKITEGSIVITDGTIGDMDTIGTMGVLESGSVVLTAGTITSFLAGTQELLGTANFIGTIGTIVGTLAAVGTVAKIGTVDNITGGTVGLVTRVGNLGTVENLNKGTITKLEGGTLGALALGTVNVTTGTMALLTRAGNLGTVEAGTITRLGGGSVVVTAATVTTQLAGTQEKLGTVNKVGTVDVLTAGTITRVQGGTIGNLASGSVVMTLGTVANVNGGTVQVDPKSPVYVTSYGTSIAGAGSTWATLSSLSGAGTYHYVAGGAIVVTSGTVDCTLCFGTVLSGTGVIMRGSFPEGGGIARSFSVPLRSSGTNSEICAEIAGAGTVQFQADFWRGT